MHALRGPQAALAELTEGRKDATRLLARLHEHFRREIELWAASDVDGVAISDELGCGASPRHASKLWRHTLKPLYGEYCQILHAADKFAFFHSEGKITDFFGDLVDLGFDAIYAQTSLADVDVLAKAHRGRVAFWLDLGLRQIAAPATQAEIRAEVRRVRNLLDYGSGVIARCPWGPETPLNNVAAFFEEWMVPLAAGAS